MKIVARAIALTVVLSLLLSGPIAPLAGAQQPQAAPSLMQETPKMSAAADESNTAAYDVGAGLANVVYVPGKTIVCTLGIAAGIGLLVLTFGSGYKAATAAGQEGCGGKWVLRGDDLRPMVRTEEADRPRY